MAIVGEPYNVDTHANNPGLFKTMLCPWLCVRLYCTPVHTDCDCTVVSLTDQSIASIQGTPHTHDTHKHMTQTMSNVELGFPDYKIAQHGRNFKKFDFKAVRSSSRYGLA